MIIKSFLLLCLALNVCLAGKAGIIRPCRFYDRKCIADNLKANSRCTPIVRGFVPNQYTIRNVRFEAPFFNASFIDRSLTIRNHDKCRISEFYYNVPTDSLVLSVDCPNLVLESNRTLIQHRSKQEDSCYNYHICGTYPLIRLTAHIRDADKLDLCSSFVFGDVTELPIFAINPLDKKTQNFLSRDLTLLNVFERECIFYRAHFLMCYFINSLYCNFGCN
ncbi:unnamed protein product [Chilo suppressalis]|uniref:Fibrohexamerin n=1 Tax=Chilo suppressalis TaxID=168631 RepID=A0ABN8B4U6_CHISP|nr:hypothetical protein evm_005590 [Chilo suppressalis]CAH0404273.1 unnamed protein product [Chilo suppressalis]